MSHTEPLSEERLAEIECDHAENCPITQIHSTDAVGRMVDRAIRAEDDDDHCDIVALLAEVRRLRTHTVSPGVPFIHPDDLT